MEMEGVWINYGQSIQWERWKLGWEVVNEKQGFEDDNLFLHQMKSNS